MRALVARVPVLQGIFGALLVSGGVFVEFGAGWAAIALGGFLLLGAWSSR